LATYTGWNVRSAKPGAEGKLSRFIGAYFPFSRTPAERGKAGDPRRAILERYPTRQEYLDRVAASARALRQQRHLLEEDAATILQEAAARKLWETD